MQKSSCFSYLLQLSAPVGRSYMAWNEIQKNATQMSSFTYLLQVSAPVGVILTQNNNIVDQNAKAICPSR
jgi:hypothetical protein